MVTLIFIRVPPSNPKTKIAGKDAVLIWNYREYSTGSVVRIWRAIVTPERTVALRSDRHPWARHPSDCRVSDKLINRPQEVNRGIRNEHHFTVNVRQSALRSEKRQQSGQRFGKTANLILLRKRQDQFRGKSSGIYLEGAGLPAPKTDLFR